MVVSLRWKQNKEKDKMGRYVNRRDLLTGSGTATAAAAMMSITAADMPTTLAIVSFLLIYTNIAFVSDCARNIVTHILYHAPDRKASVNMN